MSPDKNKIADIIKFALLVAGEEDDFFDRQLGPIHILKYVYLADLYFAKRKNGTIFTGVAWQFYNFGPWSPVVHDQISPSLIEIGAQCDVIESQYGDDDFRRWSKRNFQLIEELESRLPFSITTKLRQDIHKYLKDTPNLLDYVYKTEPMLKAAPNEKLDFSNLTTTFPSEKKQVSELRMNSLSIKKKKKFSTKMAELRIKLKNNHSNHQELASPVKHPRYDDIYDKGINWLDSMPGKKLTESSVTAHFSEATWSSKARKGDDVP